jgi:multiple sugar transport system substrate-binding protein/putative aldouronate transport system substrate-binding protein
VYLHWYEWQRGFWNSPERGNARENYIAIPVEDMYLFQDGDSYYGDGRVIGVGSKVTGAKREKVLQLLDWLASPEGLEYCHNGIKDFNYTVLPDGSYVRTPEGEVAVSANPPVPAEWGGGGWNDGNQKINTYVAHVISIDPKTKYPYEYSLWPAEIEKAKTVTNREWEAKYGAADPVDYFTKHNQLGVVPRVNVVFSPEPTDIQLIRSQCAALVKDTSWKMIFAGSEAEFNKLWTDMKGQLTGFGWDKLVAYDLQKFQAVVDARNEILRDAK